MSLIASVYGMNFENMPEIKWEYGYPFALGLMLLVAIVRRFGVFYCDRSGCDGTEPAGGPSRVWCGTTECRSDRPVGQTRRISAQDLAAVTHSM